MTGFFNFWLSYISYFWANQYYFAGSLFGPNIPRWGYDDDVSNLGQAFIAINPNNFISDFKDRLTILMDYLRNMEPVSLDRFLIFRSDFFFLFMYDSFFLVWAIWQFLLKYYRLLTYCIKNISCNRIFPIGAKKI